LQINFIMSDLCSNYASLRDDCRQHPAPSVASMVDPTDMNDIRPFLGLMAENNMWLFQDEIEYLLDTQSVQVKVRYAHDPFRSTRRHVVLMDLKNPSRMVTYDEVTIQYDPKNPLLPISPPQTVITNYNASVAAHSDGTDMFTDGGVDVKTRRRSLLAPDNAGQEEEDQSSKYARRRLAENVFLEHMRMKIAGFPHINVPEEFLTLSAANAIGDVNNGKIPLAEANRRMLNAVGDSRDINIDPQISNHGYCVATTLTDEQGNNLPCLSDVDGLDMQLPAAYFSNVYVSTLSGSIAWPDEAKDVYSIQEYETAQIVFRSDLKLLSEMHMYDGTSAPTASPSSPHRLLTSSSPEWSMMALTKMHFDDHHQENRIHGHLNKHEARNLQVKADFEALDRALGKIIDFHKKTEHISRAQLEELREQRRQLTIKTHTTSIYDDASLTPYYTDGAKARETATVHASLSITSAFKLQLQNKLPSFLWGKIEQYLQTPQSDFPDQYKVPMRRGYTCAEFHNLMAELLLDVADLDDVLLKTIKYSNAVNNTLSVIPKLQTKLNAIIEVNNLMKPVIAVVSKIPYVGGVAKAFQTAFNAAVTSPITPVKAKLDAIQVKINQYKIKQGNSKYLINAKKTATGVNNFITGSALLSDGLVAVDDSCFWTPTIVNGKATYNFTATGVICKDLSVPLKVILGEVNALKVKLNTFLGQITLLGGLMEQALDFDVNFDIGILSTLKSIFATLSSFLTKQISICIPWVCTRTQTTCTTITYPCGVNTCCGWYGCWPCGVRTCSSQTCVSIPIPYACSQCATFSIQQILDGLMSVVDQLQQLIWDALNSLASALNITFPTFTFPGLPSLDFLTGIDNFLASILANFDTIFDAFTLNMNVFLVKFNLITWPTVCPPKP
jgi:hypothetical protein